MMPRYADVLSEIKDTEGRVAYLMDKYPELIEADANYLIAKFWANYNNIQVSPDYIAKLTPMETITRARRKLATKYPEKYASKNPKRRKTKEQRFVAFQEYGVQDKI